MISRYNRGVIWGRGVIGCWGRGVIGCGGRSMIRSWGMIRSRGRSMVRCWGRGVVRSWGRGMIRGWGVVFEGLVRADFSFIFDISVVLLVLVHEVVYNLGATVGKLDGVLAFNIVSLSSFMPGVDVRVSIRIILLHGVSKVIVLHGFFMVGFWGVVRGGGVVGLRGVIGSRGRGMIGSRGVIGGRGRCVIGGWGVDSVVD